MQRRSIIAAVLVAGLAGFGVGGGARLWASAGAADSPPAPEFLNADPESGAPYSDAVRVGSMLYLAGQLGLGSDGKLVPGGITPESEQTMENLKHTLERNGSSLDRVVSCLLLLADIREREAFNAVYARHFAKAHFPARARSARAASTAVQESRSPAPPSSADSLLQAVELVGGEGPGQASWPVIATAPRRAGRSRTSACRP